MKHSKTNDLIDVGNTRLTPESSARTWSKGYLCLVASNASDYAPSKTKLSRHQHVQPESGLPNHRIRMNMNLKLNLHSQVFAADFSAAIYRVGHNAANGSVGCGRGNERECFWVFKQLPEVGEFADIIVLRTQWHLTANRGSAGSADPHERITKLLKATGIGWKSNWLRYTFYPWRVLLTTQGIPFAFVRAQPCQQVMSQDIPDDDSKVVTAHFVERRFPGALNAHRLNKVQRVAVVDAMRIAAWSRLQAR